VKVLLSCLLRSEWSLIPLSQLTQTLVSWKTPFLSLWRFLKQMLIVAKELFLAQAGLVVLNIIETAACVSTLTPNISLCQLGLYNLLRIHAFSEMAVPTMKEQIRHRLSLSQLLVRLHD
jgi:hypothetical protein